MSTSQDQKADFFLSLVARDLYAKFGGDLSHTAIVFPNKRAGLFFNEFLAAQSDRPLWSPAYMSISELFESLSDLKKGDPIKLVCELHKVFCAETGSEETLDDFYFWGELLISDFDDVDKNLVQAEQLFTNLQELKAISDNFDFLEPEQEAAIRQFFNNFSLDKHTRLKDRFIKMWDRLGDIYRHYRATLREQGIAYEGMLVRDIAEADSLPTNYERYVFVGFNVLNRVETRFFQRLQEAGKALFYWDYDQFYTRLPQEMDPPFNHEAGEFLLRNLRLFPNQLPEDAFDVLRHPKRVTYIASSTENGQARYIPQWIREVIQSEIHTEDKEASSALPEENNTEEISAKASQNIDWKESAIVLCNEALLLPVLHSLPEGIEHVNITMGFPLTQTPVYSFLNSILDLQTKGYNPRTGRFYFEQVDAVLKHPYVQILSDHARVLEQRLTNDNRFYPLPSELSSDELLTKIFTPVSGNLQLCEYLINLLTSLTKIYQEEEIEDEEETRDKTKAKLHSSALFSQLYRESLFKSYTIVNRLHALIEGGDLVSLRTDTLICLLHRLLSAATIPFHGEPAIGLQVMGVLETRNLDFRHLLMLSLNEGQLPKADGESSFIPYNLRKAFGMTTLEHKNSVYAYYFYRLIERAEDITLLYNTSTDGLNRGEMSRFMLQFKVEWPHPIRERFLKAGQAPTHARPIVIDKTPEVLRCLYDRFAPQMDGKQRALSPSAINSYLNCELSFYYRYVANIHAPEEVTCEIDNALFGSIFHHSAQLVYHYLSDACRRPVTSDRIVQLLKDRVKIESFVDQSFRELFFHVKNDEVPEYNGLQLIQSRVIATYLRQLLRHDQRYAPFELDSMEQWVDINQEVMTPFGPLKLRLGGIVDRTDIKDGTFRVVDYKTGGKPSAVPAIEFLFTPSPTRNSHAFQAFFYSSIFVAQRRALSVSPALLYIHQASQDDYNPVIEFGQRNEKAPISNFARFASDFDLALQRLLTEIFCDKPTFSQTDNDKHCEYCDYKKICGR